MGVMRACSSGSTNCSDPHKKLLSSIMGRWLAFVIEPVHRSVRDPQRALAEIVRRTTSVRAGLVTAM